MCVGLKVKIADIENGMAVVDASGVKRTISAELIDDLAPGDYVMVHAGIAIAKIEGDEDTEADEVMEAVNGN
ncbi:MAG: HypC/HybG/HupF family hydrogenase formation chaperone [Eubacteriaceae bacterium]|jgi:hydrogenase expression/formation protein HypC|nr:HypC/HybG/HupF family hydrogenase formation chaperone [Eubacteriaceae bacterium]